MAGMLDQLMGSLGGDALGGLLGALGGGGDRSATEKVIQGGLGAILGGLARNATKRDGADSLFNAINRDHDGSILDNLGGLFGANDHTDGDKILGHVLGNKREAVEQKLVKDSGLDLSFITKLLPILAPIVLGYLGRRAKQNQLDAGGLAGLLGQERYNLESGSLGLGGLFDVLDADDDGSIMDEVGGLVDKVKDFFTGDDNN